MEKKPNQENRPSEKEMSLYIASITNENKELKARLNAAMQAVDSMQTQNLFSYINFAMKVMEHPEMYSEDFVNSMSKDTEDLMMRLHEVIVEPENEDGNGETAGTASKEA